MTNAISADTALATFTVPTPAWKQILRDCATEAGVTVPTLISSSREKHLVRARHKAMFRMREELRLSWPTIARRCGRTDHATAFYGAGAYRRRAERGDIAPVPAVDPRFYAVRDMRRNGATYATIAAAIGVPEGSISAIYHTGLHRIRLIKNARVAAKCAQ